jgi:hypothetical protein
VQNELQARGWRETDRLRRRAVECPRNEADLHPGLRLAGFKRPGGRGAGAVPQTGEVGLAIGGVWRGGVEVRFASAVRGIPGVRWFNPVPRPMLSTRSALSPCEKELHTPSEQSQHEMNLWSPWST